LICFHRSIKYVNMNWPNKLTMGRIIAIPVNRYRSKFVVNTSTSYNTMINNYKNKSNSYISEGYFVCDINLDEGFKIKGIISHDEIEKLNKKNAYNNTSKLLRGLYIENDLYTVSENQIKVNDLNTLEEKASIKINEGGK